MVRLLIATANEGKLREYAELLAGLGLELEGRPPGVDESGQTYEANAALKAEAVATAARLPTLADDTGLEIEALDDFPGLRSARLAPTPEERNRLVLERLAGVPRPWRARFVCALALACPGRPVRLFRGERAGEVVEPPPANGGGFGYDPVFLVPEAGLRFAQMDPPEKNRWSHRGAAVRTLLASGALSELSSTLRS